MIITECYRDTALVYRIGFPGDQVRHEFGRSRVLGRVEKEQKAVIGIIDEDPGAGRHPSMKEYKLQNCSTKAIRLWKREDDDTKRLIEISPYFETWLYLVSRRNQIFPEKFNLPDTPEELHKLPFREDENFRRFLIALNKTKDDEFNMFKKWIQEAIIYK